MKVTPTQQRLHELFYIVDGVMYWKIRPANRVKVGDIAGTKTSHGYLQTYIDNKLYRCHRLVFKYYFGYDPVSDIDHIDGDRTNNNPWNLRDVNRQQNARNNITTRDNHNGQLQWTTHNGKRVRTPYGKEIAAERARNAYHNNKVSNNNPPNIEPP